MMNKDLKEKLREVDYIVDGFGHPIDKRIKKTVAALMLLGFHTSASCEGHTDWGRAYPWVDVNNGPEFSLRDKAERQALKTLLDEFYSGRYFPPFTIANMGILGGFRLMPSPDITYPGDKRSLKFYQEAMRKFTNFLIEKYEHTRASNKRLG